MSKFKDVFIHAFVVVISLIPIVVFVAVLACGHYVLNDILHHLTNVSIGKAGGIVLALYMFCHVSYLLVWMTSLVTIMILFMDIALEGSVSDELSRQNVSRSV